MMVGLHVHRIECDELWAYVGHKRNPQQGPKRRPSPVMGDQYTYVALASSTRAIIGYRTGNRDGATTDDFIQDLRRRVIGVPEISTDGLHYYKSSIRDAFGKRAAHGVIQKTYSVTHLNVTEASRRYSPAQGSSRRAAGRSRRARTDFDKLCGAAKSNVAHGLEAVCSIEQWI
jgi:IS1 family transposase